jgi:hypothetical protein
MLARPPLPTNPIDRMAGQALAWLETTYARYAAAIGAAALALYILVTAATAWFLPDANWDMLAYLAVAEEDRIPDPQALHDFAYGAVRAGVPDAAYHALVDDGGGLRSHMAGNAADFHSLLSMYRVKFLYAEVLSALSHVMSPVEAMRAVSVFSVLLFGAFTLMWLRGDAALALAPIAIAILNVAGFSSLARASTPDLLCSALFLGGAFAYHRRNEPLTAAMLFVAFLARPDNIVFLAVFAVLLAAFRQRAWGAYAGAAASLVAYLAISRWAGHPGWWTHLWFSSIEQHYNMDGFSPAFSVAAYLKAFAVAGFRAIDVDTWVGVAVLTLAGWYAASRAGFRLDRRAGILFAALVLGALAKFAVFPFPDNRIYFPHLMPAVLLVAVPLTALFSAAALERRRQPVLSVQAGE